MKTKTQTVSAWLPDWKVEYAGAPEQVPASELAYCHIDSSMDRQGWLRVGTAEITVTFCPSAEMTERAAEGIREQMREAAGKYHAMQAELQARLDKLLAITNEVDA